MKVAESPRELLAIAIDAAWRIDEPAVGAVIGELADETSVRIVDDKGTACIHPTGDGYEIRFSRHFLRDWIRSSQDLLFVLLHELMHKIRGDLLRAGVDWSDPWQRYCANIVADVCINAFLHERFYPKGVDLLGRMYRDTKGPAALLYPPLALARDLNRRGITVDELCGVETVFDVLGSERALWMARVSLRRERVNERTHALADLYEALWSQKTTFARAYRTLLEMNEKVQDVLFLGEHDAVKTDGQESPAASESSAGSDGAEADGQNARITSALSGPYATGKTHDKGAPTALPKNCSGLFGGFSEKMDARTIEVSSAQQAARKISRLIRQALESFHLPSSLQSSSVVTERSVIPGTGRRSTFLLSSGVWPGFFEHIQFETTRDHDWRVHLYLDVSDSTKSLQPFLYGFVRELVELVGEEIYLFSNRVVPIDRSELVAGRCETTGGTDFNCVIEHAVASGFRRIVVVTDGLAAADPARRALAEKGKLGAWLLLVGAATRWKPDRSNIREERWVRQVWRISHILRGDGAAEE